MGAWTGDPADAGRSELEVGGQQRLEPERDVRPMAIAEQWVQVPPGPRIS